MFGLHYTDDAARPFALTTEQVRAMHENLARWKRADRPLMFSASMYERVIDWVDYRVLTKRREHGSPHCMAGRFYVHIEANGDVWPCQQHGASSFTPRNVVQDGLEEALRHVREHDCGDCYTVYLNERKAVFGLRPGAILEVVRRG